MMETKPTYAVQKVMVQPDQPPAPLELYRCANKACRAVLGHTALYNGSAALYLAGSVVPAFGWHGWCIVCGAENHWTGKKRRGIGGSKYQTF